MLKHTYSQNMHNSTKSLNSHLDYVEEDLAANKSKSAKSFDTCEKSLGISEYYVHTDEGDDVFWWDRKGEEALMTAKHSTNQHRIYQDITSSSGQSSSDMSMMSEGELKRTARSVWKRTTDPSSDLSMVLDRMKTRSLNQLKNGEKDFVSRDISEEKISLRDAKMNASSVPAITASSSKSATDPEKAVPRHDVNCQLANETSSDTWLKKIRGRFWFIGMAGIALLLYIILLHFTIQSGRLSAVILQDLVKNLTEARYQLQQPNEILINHHDMNMSS